MKIKKVTLVISTTDNTINLLQVQLDPSLASPEESLEAFAEHHSKYQGAKILFVLDGLVQNVDWWAGE